MATAMQGVPLQSIKREENESRCSFLLSVEITVNIISPLPSPSLWSPLAFLMMIEGVLQSAFTICSLSSGINPETEVTINHSDEEFHRWGIEISSPAFSRTWMEKEEEDLVWGLFGAHHWNPHAITELYTRAVLSKGYRRLDCLKLRRAWTETLSNAAKGLRMWVLLTAKGLEHRQHRNFNIRHSKMIKWF